MKVVHVVRQFHPSVGGLEDVVLNLARHHVRLGGEVEVLTLDRLFTARDERLAARDEHLGLPIRRIGYRGSTRYPLAPAVLAGLGSADLVHVHGIDFFYDFLAATRLLHRKPMVVSTHGGFFHTTYASRLKRLWFGSITRASALAYAKVIATSENDGQVFARVVSPARLQVIENGVDVEKFAGRANPQPGRTLIYFGRWSVNKGLLETLDLLAALQRLDPQWRLVLAGREYDFDRQALREQARARGVEAQVELVVAPDQRELGELIARAQFFVCLSRHEGFGLAAVEAMSAGLLPVLSDIPPFVRLQRESGQGVLVTPDRIEQGAARVQALAEASDTLLAGMQRACMAFAGRYDWRQVGDRYEREYQAVLQSRPSVEAA